MRHGGQCKRHEVIVREVDEYFKEVQTVKQPQESYPTPDKPPWTPQNGGGIKSIRTEPSLKT